MPSQLQELRALTEFSGAVHEKQMHQLRIWPMVAFKPAPASAVATVDPENKIVVYKLDWKKGRSTGKAAKKERQASAERMSAWIRELFGSSWSVVVQSVIGGKEDGVFEFIRNDPKPQREDPLDALRSVSWRTRFKRSQERKGTDETSLLPSRNETGTPTN